MNNLYWFILVLNNIIFMDFFYVGLFLYFVYSYSFGFFLILYFIIIVFFYGQIQIWKLGFDFIIYIYIISVCKYKENIMLMFIQEQVYFLNIDFGY